MCDTTQNLFNGKTVIQNQEIYTRHHAKNNLSLTEYQALRALRANDDVVIKGADKGGAVVVMQKTLYRQEALRQLHNTKYYRPLPGPIYTETAQKLTVIVDHLKREGYITAKQHEFLKPDINKIEPRYFYLLPKIHKQHSAWPHPLMPPGRPIVADLASDSSNICKYIDFFLKPLAVQHAAYLKDTYDFLDKVKGKRIEPHWILFTADVESLYTNMRFDRILYTIAHMFNLYPDPSRPDSLILELIRIILNNNDFIFDGLFYLQVLGMSMGRKFAPSAADIYLIEFDEKAAHGFHIKPEMYFRFLDDVFGLWPGSLEQLREFEDFLNNLIPDIHITITARHKLIEYLDTRVYKYIDPQGNCFLHTKPYFKPTNTHQLLHTDSFHPRHTFRGLTKSQFIRFKRISSTFADYQEACSTLTHTLLIRGYRKSLLLKQKRQIWKGWKEKSALAKEVEQNTELIPVVTYFDNFHTRLNRKWRDKIIANPIFEDCRIISAYKRHRNISDWLVRGRFGKETPEDSPEALLQALVEILEKDPDAMLLR